MSCNGAAVARGVIAIELAELLKDQDEAVRNGLIMFLKKTFPHLGKTAVKSLYWCGTGTKVKGITLQLGGKYNITFNARKGKVLVNTQGFALAREADNVKAIESGLTALLTGLGGVALQNRILSAIKAAGHPVISEQRAGNGALVASIDLSGLAARVVVTLDGKVSVITTEGTFEDGKGKIEGLLAQLGAQGLTITLERPIESHRHDDPQMAARHHAYWHGQQV